MPIPRSPSRNVPRRPSTHVPSFCASFAWSGRRWLTHPLPGPEASSWLPVTQTLRVGAGSQPFLGPTPKPIRAASGHTPTPYHTPNLCPASSQGWIPGIKERLGQPYLFLGQTLAMGCQGVHSGHISLGTALSQYHSSTTKFHLPILYHINSVTEAVLD